MEPFAAALLQEVTGIVSEVCIVVPTVTMDTQLKRFSKEFHEALRRALSECVKQRPADPFKFIAGRSPKT